MLSPQQYHRTHHDDAAVPFEACRPCQRAGAVCRQKIRYATWAEANEWVREFNESTSYARPVVRYRCRWCEGWHMTTAKDKRSRARAERQRRKWLRG